MRTAGITIPTPATSTTKLLKYEAVPGRTLAAAPVYSDGFALVGTGPLPVGYGIVEFAPTLVLGAEVSTGVSPTVGVAVCVGISSESVALNSAISELASTSSVAVSETVV